MMTMGGKCLSGIGTELLMADKIMGDYKNVMDDIFALLSMGIDFKQTEIKCRQLISLYQ
jgi:hypothetical protein